MLAIKEVQAKSILNKSKVFHYCVNAYTGCQHDCQYCYARLFMRRYSGHKEAWGEFVDVKINAPEVLRKQLPRAKRGTVWISSVCDPYQPLEVRYRLTRQCLEDLAVREGAIAVIGPVLSVNAKAILESSDAFQIPVFSPTASSPDVVGKSKFFMRNCI